MDQRVVIGRVAAPLLVSTVLVATPLQAQITPSQSLQQRLQEDQLRLRLLELESDQRDDPFPGSLQPNSYGLAGAGFGMDLGRVGQGLLCLRAAFPIGANPASGSFIDLEASAPSPRLWAGVQLWL